MHRVLPGMLLCGLIALAAPTATSQSFSNSNPGPLAVIEDMNHGPRATIRVSGSDADHSIDWIVPDGGYVYAIEMGERNNRPCHINLKYATVDDGEMSFGEKGYGCTPTQSSLRNAGPLYSETSPKALKGIQVYQRNSNDRVKGLSVRAVHLTSGNGVRVRTRPVLRQNSSSWATYRFTRTNGNDWDDMESCGNQQVVVGVRIEVDNHFDRNRQIIKGLAPVCARLEFDRM
ncbi:MAG: hypothetical protein AAF791_06935 [Bacteroidota bacterium]